MKFHLARFSLTLSDLERSILGSGNRTIDLVSRSMTERIDTVSCLWYRWRQRGSKSISMVGHQRAVRHGDP